MFEDRQEKLTKNLDIGTNEFEINSFYLNFISKGIKNAMKTDNKENCLSSLANFGFAQLQDQFLNNIDIENESNPVWEIFSSKQRRLAEEAID